MSQSTDAGPQLGKIWYHIGIILAVVAWGISFVSTRVLLDNGLTPTQIFIYRFTGAYLLVLLFCHKKILSNRITDELLFMVCGVCGNTIYYLAENTALEYTLVSNVSLITTMSPLFTALLLGAMYKSERPGAGMLAGSLVAILGVGCVIFNSSFVIKMNPLGDLLSMAAAVSFALYTVVLRRLNALYSVMFISRKTFFYGVVFGLPFLILEPDGAPLEVLVRWDIWGNLIFLIVICSMLGFIILAQAVKHIGTVTANNYIYFQPIVTLVASALILGERVTAVGYLGCSLILIGVVMADWLSRRQATRKLA